MINIFKKNLVHGLIALTVSIGFSGLAEAAGPISSIATATETAVFSKATSASLIIKPNSGLMAGDYENQESLGSVIVTSQSGIPIIRWTPGVGYIYKAQSSKTPNAVTVTGEASATNKLSIYLANDDYTFMDNPTGQGWLIPINLPSDKNDITFLLSLDGAQHINPDKYTISLDGAVWVN